MQPCRDTIILVPANACFWTTPKLYAEQVAMFLGADEIDPPLELDAFEFSSWSEISQVCGNSRVWGGLHFAVSLRRCAFILP